MMTDETADRRQRIDFTDEFQGLFEFPFGNEGHVTSRILANWACLLTRRERDLSSEVLFSPVSTIDCSSEAFFFVPIF
jgi:hypothetical protein